MTERKGGERAVAEACLNILEMFLEAYNPNVVPKSKPTGRGEWGL